MNSEWIETKLIDIIVHKKGFAFKSKDYTFEGTPIVKVTNTTSNSIDMTNVVFINNDLALNHSSVKLQKNDTVIATVGSWPTNPASVVGKTIKVPLEADGALLNQNAVIIRPKDNKKLDKLYLYYMLKDNSFSTYLVKNAQGSANQASITLDDIYAYETFLPSILTQKKIAHILSTLDDKIELNRKMNQTLEAMAQAIFKSWFVDFDPVHAKAKCSSESELEAAAKELGISKEVLELFPSEFEESELGMIPKGWKTTKFSDIASVRKGLSYKGKHKSEDNSDTPMFNLGNFDRSGQYRPEKLVYYNGEYNKRHLIRSGQLMIANTDMTQERIILGLPLIVPDESKSDMIFTHHVFAIDFLNISMERLLKYYIFYTFLNPKFREVAEGYATGTTVLALPKDGVMKFDLLLAPDNLISPFNKVVSALVDKMDVNKKEIKSLKQIRDTLLPKLLSGDLDVSELKLDIK